MVKSIASMQDKELTTKDKIKMGVGIAICFGADMVITTLIGHHMPSLKGWKKAMTMLGTFMIGMKVGEDIENYFYQVCDDTETALKEAKNEIDEVSKEVAAEMEAENAGQ